MLFILQFSKSLLKTRKHGLKIALDEKLTKRMHGDSDLSLMNYEFIYKVITKKLSH